MKDLLQLRAFQQPPQKLLNLSTFQPLIVGVITLLESRGRDVEEATPWESWPVLTHLSSTTARKTDVPHFTGRETES